MPTLSYPIPREQWPLWAKAVALASNADDTGVGDTVHRQAGALGVAFSVWTTALGIPCGCTTRRAEWNVAYAYELKTRDPGGLVG